MILKFSKCNERVEFMLTPIQKELVDTWFKTGKVNDLKTDNIFRAAEAIGITVDALNNYRKEVTNSKEDFSNEKSITIENDVYFFKPYGKDYSVYKELKEGYTLLGYIKVGNGTYFLPNEDTVLRKNLMFACANFIDTL